MPTIAELQIKVDTSQAEQSTKTLNGLADASTKVTKALKEQKAAADALNNGGGNGGGGGGGGNGPKPINDLSSAIDNQTKKLKALEEQRKALNSSDLKLTNPAEYARLNQLIDSNIELTRRQGNAMDRVAQQAAREQKAKEQSAEAEARRLEAQQRAINSNEALAARASARAARDLEQTLNGLSAQIKAQNEYNATIEQLNRARVTGGMNGGTSSLSSAEYDSYVKLAAAKRDEALATRDNSREQDAARSKIDSVTATLGRAERAEVQYTRALATLNDGLRLGVLTAEQYSVKLQQIGAKRDASIASANSNTAAEARFARELQNVLTSYDPLLRATLSYNEAIKVLSTGLQTGKLSADQFNRALQDQRVALDAVKAAQPNSEQSQANRYQQAVDRLLPYNAQLRNLAEAERALQTQQAAGRVTSDQQIKQHKDATEAIAAERREIERRMDASRRAGNSAKQDAAALRGVPAQITDIVVSLQGGQAPLTVLLQQGGQLKDMFGGIVPAVKALGTSLLSMISITTVGVSALVLLGAAANAGASEVIAFQRATISSAAASGVSTSQFVQFRDALDRTTGTAGAAAEALILIQKSGKVAGEVFVEVAEAAILFEKATGQAISKTVEDFTSLGKDPVNAAIRLDENYRFLTASILQQADALFKQGREVEATTLLQGQLAEATTTAATEIIDRAGLMEKAWRGVKVAVSETWDALKDVGRTQSTADNLRDLETAQQYIELGIRGSRNIKTAFTEELIANNKIYQQNATAIIQLKQRIQYEDLSAKAASDAEVKRREAVSFQAAAQRRYENTLKGTTRAENELRKVKLENSKITAGGNVTPEQTALMAKNLEYAEKELALAKEKDAKPGKAPALQTGEVQEVKNNLRILEAEYDGYYKRVTALGEANVVSDEATYYSQKAILEAQVKVVTASYDEQINQINKLKGNKKNSAAQNLSLDNQLTKAEADKVIALEKLDARQDVLSAKEKGRIDKRTASISAYKEALDAQLESLRVEGERAVEGAGRGDREAAVAKQLADNDRTFDKQQRSLAKSLGEGMDPVEYAEKLRDLKDAHTEMTTQIIANDEGIKAANSDWTNGFTKAIENATDEANNFAKSTEQAVSGAFNSMGDALANFVTTGKLDFKSLAVSIISDIAKIAAKQAALGTLSSIFSAFGGGFGAAASAGTTVASSGFSEYGQITTVQKDGGAWNGGKQFFANGGAFTNSVVSSATSFPMTGGKTGVMGEAGPEAIIPLSRTADGSLGVKMVGGGGSGGGVIVYVNVTGDGNTTSTTDTGYSGFGKEIGDFVESKYKELQSRDLAAGGTLNRAITER